MRPPGSTAFLPDLSSIGRGRWTTFAYGESRPAVLRVLYALAAANDASPIWVDLRAPDSAPDPDAPPALGWIAPERLFVATESEARPQDAIGNLALWTMIRSDEPDAAVTQLTDFLRLPPTVQEAVSRADRPDAAPVLVIANSDRVREHYPRTPEGVRPILESVTRAGVVPMFGATSPPGPGRMAFDLVLEVRAEGIGGWRRGSLWCEKAPAQSGFTPGTGVPLGDLPGLVAVFERDGASQSSR